VQASGEWYISLMNGLINVREPPPNRRAMCDGGQECHLTEAAVMIAFALHLLQNGASQVC
jgi:hypothetical protein